MTIDANTLMQAIQQWSQGQQDQAKSMIRPLADAGDPQAQFVMSWFLHQQGEPAWREAVPYARAAVTAGYPHAAAHVVGNMVNDPTLVGEAIELARLAASQGVGVLDPMGQAVSMAQQGNLSGVESVLSAPWPVPGPFPNSPEQWNAIVRSAQDTLHHVKSIDNDVSTKHSDAVAAMNAAIDEVAATRSRIESQSTQLLKLISQTTNAEASSHFDAEATASETQASKTWATGVGVVIAAAVIALFPLVAYYSNAMGGPGVSLDEGQLLSAHVTAAIAFGTVSGILLARSRVRDRNRQRNKDLSVALNTMFSYSTQIDDPVERQNFTRDMGRTVIEAYLRQESGATGDDVRGMLGALAAR